MGLRKVTKGEIGLLGASVFGIFQCMEYFSVYIHTYQLYF